MAKAVKGRKRHLIVDTLGLLLAIVVHRADIDERPQRRTVRNRFCTGSVELFTNQFARLSVIFADAGYGHFMFSFHGNAYGSDCVRVVLLTYSSQIYTSALVAK